MIEDAELVEPRRQWLLATLGQQRRIVTNDAAVALGVSVDTVRRDLRALDADGLLRRVHGGAVPRSNVPASFADRSAVNGDGRSRLAAAIVARLRPGMVVGLDAGTTGTEVARRLPVDLAVTVVTNSPPAVTALAGHPSARVVLVGGIVDLDWMATVGPDAVAAWAGFHLDVAVLGVCALDAELGAATNSLAEVATKRALVASAAEVIVPVLADKLGTTASFVIGPATDIGTVLTDAAAGAPSVDALRAMGVGVELV